MLQGHAVCHLKEDTSDFSRILPLSSKLIHNNNYMRIEVLKAVMMLRTVFWVVMPWRLLGRYQHFRGIY
jgi:hypothetical protein